MILQLCRDYILTFPYNLYCNCLNSYQRHFQNQPYFENRGTKLSPTLVFIHGRNGAPIDFKYYFKKFIDYNYIAIQLNNDFNIYCQAFQLNDFLRNYFTDNDNNGIIFIGMSKGGLVGLTAAAYTDLRIIKIITIGSPLRGTDVAKFASDKISRQELISNSPITNDIYSLTFKNSVMEGYYDVHNIYCRYDYLVVPIYHGYYENIGTKTEINSLCGHMGLLLNNKVVTTILDVIKDYTISHI